MDKKILIFGDQSRRSMMTLWFLNVSMMVSLQSWCAAMAAGISEGGSCVPAQPPITSAEGRAGQRLFSVLTRNGVWIHESCKNPACRPSGRRQ